MISSPPVSLLLTGVTGASPDRSEPRHHCSGEERRVRPFVELAGIVMTEASELRDAQSAAVDLFPRLEEDVVHNRDVPMTDVRSEHGRQFDAIWVEPGVEGE